MNDKITENGSHDTKKPADSTEGHSQPLKFRPFDEDHRQALVEHCRRLEETGDLYPRNVEIIYPPQVKAKCGRDGVIVSVHDILLWIADRIKGDRPESAAEYISIAEEFYAPDEEFDDFDGSLEDGVLEAIAEYADEMELRG